jgi:Flp pilus assembly protein TadD
VEAQAGLGRLYLGKRKPKEALAAFQAALAADPKHVRALNGAGIALDLLGRNQEAQASYRAALAINADDPAVRNNLGLSLALSGAYDQAIAELSPLAQQAEANPRMRHNLALAFGLKGDEIGAAKLERIDLNDSAIAENQRFFAAVRRLAPSNNPSSIQYRPAAASQSNGS